MSLSTYPMKLHSPWLPEVIQWTNIVCLTLLWNCLDGNEKLHAVVVWALLVAASCCMSQPCEKGHLFWQAHRLYIDFEKIWLTGCCKIFGCNLKKLLVVPAVTPKNLKLHIHATCNSLHKISPSLMHFVSSRCHFYTKFKVWQPRRFIWETIEKQLEPVMPVFMNGRLLS